MNLIFKLIKEKTGTQQANKMSNLIKSAQFEINNVTFNIKVDKETKRKVVYVNHNKQPILIQTPKMYFPNGIKRWQSTSYPESFELELSFGEDKENSINNEKIKDIHNKMKSLDVLIKEQILNNPKEWIGKPKTNMEMIEQAFYPNPIVRVPKDKEGNVLEYPDRMRLKVERERDGDNFTGNFVSNRRAKTKVLAFDEKNEPIQLDEDSYEMAVPKGSKGIVVIELVNINIVGDKVYPKWKLIQTKVFRNQKSITQNIIDDDDEIPDDLDSETQQVLKLSLDTDIESTVKTDVADDDVDEVDEESDEQIVVAPAKKGRSKKV